MNKEFFTLIVTGLFGGGGISAILTYLNNRMKPKFDLMERMEKEILRMDELLKEAREEVVSLKRKLAEVYDKSQEDLLEKQREIFLKELEIDRLNSIIKDLQDCIGKMQKDIKKGWEKDE